MKIVSAALIGLLFASSASAAPQTLATMKEVGGYCPVQCPTTTLTILDNGQVEVERSVYHPVQATTKTVVARLSRAVVNVIKADIAQTTPAELVDENPTVPFCADIPYKYFSVMRDGKTIEIGIERDCHNFVLANNDTNSLVETLKSLEKVFQYSLRGTR